MGAQASCLPNSAVNSKARTARYDLTLPSTCLATAARINRGTTTQPNPERIRQAASSGIERWIQTNYRQE